MQIDIGSEANCLRMEDFVSVQNQPDNGERVFPKGEVYLDIQIGGKITRAKFVVIDDASS